MIKGLYKRKDNNNLYTNAYSATDTRNLIRDTSNIPITGSNGEECIQEMGNLWIPPLGNCAFINDNLGAISPAYGVGTKHFGDDNVHIMYGGEPYYFGIGVGYNGNVIGNCPDKDTWENNYAGKDYYGFPLTYVDFTYIRHKDGWWIIGLVDRQQQVNNMDSQIPIARIFSVNISTGTLSVYQTITQSRSIVVGNRGFAEMIKCHIDNTKDGITFLGWGGQFLTIYWSAWNIDATISIKLSTVSNAVSIRFGYFNETDSQIYFLKNTNIIQSFDAEKLLSTTITIFTYNYTLPFIGTTSIISSLVMNENRIICVLGENLINKSNEVVPTKSVVYSNIQESDYDFLDLTQFQNVFQNLGSCEYQNSVKGNGYSIWKNINYSTFSLKTLYFINDLLYIFTTLGSVIVAQFSIGIVNNQYKIRCQSWVSSRQSFGIELDRIHVTNLGNYMLIIDGYKDNQIVKTGISFSCVGNYKSNT